jgi:hypothetical protein
MTWLPPLPLHHPTTTEQATGRSVDGSATYIKLVKIAGAISTGESDHAHGVTGMTRLLNIYGGVSVADGRELPFPGSAAGAGTALCVRGFGTTNDIRITIGTAWTSGAALSDLWMVLEYTK